jgi:clan AA aspartic protease
VPTGIVTSSREAVLKLTIFSEDENSHEIEAVIDTGFTDYLTLPPATIRELELEFRSFTDVTLADGSTVQLGVYKARVIWLESYRSIPVIEAEGGPLLGMSLLYGSIMTMHIIDGGTVTIERLV